jgi:hypothetical protein
MKRYNLSKIMKSAHQIKKYMKLYSLTHGVKTWADCLKLAWVNEKKRASDEETKNAEKEAMEASLAEPAKRSSYDDLSIPASAYYNPYSYGCFGSHYVGD